MHGRDPIAKYKSVMAEIDFQLVKLVQNRIGFRTWHYAAWRFAPSSAPPKVVLEYDRGDLRHPDPYRSQDILSSVKPADVP